METIFEIDDVDNVDTPQPEAMEEPKKKKEPKIKKKKEMSEERKQKLREQLSRGRKTLADKRAKKKAEKEVEPKKEKSQQEKKVATKEEKSQQEPNIKMDIEKQQKNNNNDDLRNEISELKKLILEGRKPKEPKTEPVQPKAQAKQTEKPNQKLIQVLETPKVISAPIPIPKKKKRSILGGGMVLNLSRF